MEEVNLKLRLKLTDCPLGPRGPVAPWGPGGPRGPGKPGEPAIPGAPCGKRRASLHVLLCCFGSFKWSEVIAVSCVNNKQLFHSGSQITKSHGYLHIHVRTPDPLAPGRPSVPGLPCRLSEITQSESYHLTLSLLTSLAVWSVHSTWKQKKKK